MRYIIDRKTNEHERYDGQNYDATKYRIVETDSEGWIAHTGTVCPLPEDVRCEVKFADGGAGGNLKAGRYGWTGEPEYANISHYRPILTEKVQEPDARLPADCFEQSLPADKSEADKKRSIQMRAYLDEAMIAKHTDLIGRLSVAHKHAQQIPDLEAALREVLAGMGYDLVARNPFTQQRHGAGE
jgi:hypothetical protein